MSKYTFTISSDLVRAAMACQANKDVRYYLNGFAVNSAGHIVGTNGHILFKADYTTDNQQAIEHDLIIKVDGKIPLSSDKVTFEFDETDVSLGMGTGIARTDTGKVFAVALVDGKYPDYNRVIPSGSRLLDQSPMRAFNTNYLAAISQVFGKDKSISIETWNANESAIIKADQSPLSDSESIMILMPCRSDREPMLTMEVKQKAA